MNTDEQRIVREVRRALDEGLQQILPSRVNSLQNARRRALQYRKKHAQPAGVWEPALALLGLGRQRQTGVQWLPRIVATVPLIALVFGMSAVYEKEIRNNQLEQVEATAEIDAMVMADSLPLEAYTDVGFANYLAKRELGTPD